MLRYQWEKIGIDLELVMLDRVTYDAHHYAFTYRSALANNVEIVDPIHALASAGETGHFLNAAVFSDEYYDGLIARMKGEPDPVERNRLAKEAAVWIARQVANIPTNITMEAVYWWPWLRNYYGEFTIDDHSSFIPFLAYAWIDQDLKAEMGF